jgi:cell division protein FtsA
MHGQRLDVETHVITTAVASVQNVIKCVRGVGIDVEDIVLEPLASMKQS